MNNIVKDIVKLLARSLPCRLLSTFAGGQAEVSLVAYPQEAGGGPPCLLQSYNDPNQGAWCSAVQCGTVRYSAGHRSTVQYSTAQCLDRRTLLDPILTVIDGAKMGH